MTSVIMMIVHQLSICTSTMVVIPDQSDCSKFWRLIVKSKSLLYQQKYSTRLQGDYMGEVMIIGALAALCTTHTLSSPSY